MERAHEGIRAVEWPLLTGGVEWWRMDGIWGRGNPGARSVAWTGGGPARRAGSGRAPAGRPDPFGCVLAFGACRGGREVALASSLCAPGQIKRLHLPRVHLTYVPRAATATATPTGPVRSSPLTSRRGKAHYPQPFVLVVQINAFVPLTERT